MTTFVVILPTMKGYELLDRLFSSRVRIKLLEVFLGRPAPRFYIRELERLIREDAKNISRELRNLEALGLLKSESAGNQHYYEVREEFLIYPELKAIFLKTTGPQRLLKEAMENLAGVEVAIQYGPGAAASGDYPDLPLDILIIGRPAPAELRQTILLLENKIGREINAIAFTPEEILARRRNRDPFLLRVLERDKTLLRGAQEGTRPAPASVPGRKPD
jgi:hypothetical protein